MEYLMTHYGINTFSIVDDNFTHKRHHAASVCEEILKRNLDIHWDLSTNGIHMASLDADLVRLLEKAGCYMLAIAVESGTERILKDMRKPINLSKVPEVIRLIRENSDILICSYFLIGFPTETREDVLRTIHLACSLDLDYITLHIFSPLPGTEIAETLRGAGRLPQNMYERYNAHTPIIPIEGLTLNELGTLYTEGFRSFYLRPLSKSFDKHPRMKASRERMQKRSQQYFRAKRIVELARGKNKTG
jgi:magnesium-protoporphyrin IX monomethyl ester (oxidative) cyclase